MKSASSSKIVIPFPNRSMARSSEELAFLPAALEVVETPPSPIGRAIGATVIALFCVALAWACFGTIDIVASAQGKIIPTGRTKVIQPFEIGVVRAIHVRDGQSVKAGDPLIELDATMNQADREHLQSDLVAAQLDIARLNAALAGGADPVADFQAPEGASATLVRMEREFLLSQLAEHRAKLAGLERQRAQKEAERATTQATIGKLEATIPLLQERVDVRKLLWDSKLGSKLTYLTELQDLVGQQQDLLVQKSRVNEADAAIAALVEARTQAVAEFRRTLSDDLAKAEQKAAGLTQDLVRAEQRTRLQTLSAPVDGVVQQLAVHTVGGVVTPAQALLAVVPAESRLEIEAMVSNRDIGFVQEGQGAEVKVDTFNFTRYGLLHGRVLGVSRDAITRDKPAGDKSGDRAQGAEAVSSEPKGQELLYAARVSLDRTTMEVGDRTIDLFAGMAVTVEIKTGTRTVISYLLSPLLRYKHESLRER
jgi:hemolysin D